MTSNYSATMPHSTLRWLDVENVSPVSVSAIAFLILCALYLAQRSRVHSSIKLLPVPPERDWIFGHEKTVATNEPGDMYKEWANALGSTYRIKAAFGARDVLVLLDPVAITHILQKRIYDYHHSQIVRPRIGRLLGKGLGWVEGETEHKRMRHLVAPSLSHENMRRMSSEVNIGSTEVVEQWTQKVQADDGSAYVNLCEFAAQLTLTVIGRVAFLHDFEGGSSTDAQKIIQARQKSVSTTMKYAGFITLMLLRRFPILNSLSLATLQAQGLARQVIQSGVAHEMVRRNQDLVSGSTVKSHPDLLSRLLVAHSEGSITTDELYAQISTFIITGNDTSAQTLSFLIWELARHPKVQSRLREELTSFQGEPTYDDFQTKLPYLDAVVKETLRMYPGLAYMERVATKADVIPLQDPVKCPNGQVISELVVSPGQVVVIPIISIQRMDSVWKDGDLFRPERWLVDEPDQGSKAYPGWSHLLVFSDGPRNCIGMRLGVFQVKVATKALVERFRFIDTGEPISLRISSSLQACIREKPELGPCLPVHMELL